MSRHDDRHAANTLSKVLRYAGRLGGDFLLDVVALYFCWRDPETPWWAKTIAAAALAYFVIPFDALPDPIFVDDAAVVTAAVAQLRAVMLDRHRAQARRWLGERLGMHATF